METMFELTLHLLSLFLVLLGQRWLGQRWLGQPMKRRDPGRRLVLSVRPPSNDGNPPTTVLNR